MDIATTKSLCAKYDIHPSKKYGQNFIVDANVVRMMVEYANLNANDYVVEVGPGLGALTVELAKRVKQVMAVEVDKKMYEAARDILALRKNVELMQEDILKIPNPKLAEWFSTGSNNISTELDTDYSSSEVEKIPYKVVASLPYSITSAVLRKFTEPNPSLRDGGSSLSDDRPTLCVFLVQKEVAQRVCARPGEMSILSVAVQFYGKPEIVAVVKRGAFWPVPEVDSAILKIEIYGGRTSDSTEVRPHDIDGKRFFQIVRVGFSSRRKQLQNNLMAGLRLPREKVVDVLKQAGLNPQVRAQELGIEQWVKLTKWLG